MVDVKLSFGYDVERPYGKWATGEKAAAMQRTEVGTCQKLNALFDKKSVPRTFFILGQFLEHCVDNMSEEDLRTAFGVGNPQVDIQQHSYSHQVFRAAAGMIDKTMMKPDEFGRDLSKADDVLMKILGVSPVGLRTPLGGIEDLTTEPAILTELQKLDFEYVSSNMRGTEHPYLAPLTTERQPRTYAHVGFPAIVETPTHGWQDAIYTVEHAQKTMDRDPDTPEQALAHYVELLRQAQTLAPGKGNQSVFVSLCMHPWAIAEYDSDLEVHKGIIAAAKEQGVEIVSYNDISHELAHN